MYQAQETRYGSMRYSRCGNSGLLLPAVSLGFWHNFGDTSPFENSAASFARSWAATAMSSSSARRPATRCGTGLTATGAAENTFLQASTRAYSA